MKVRALLIFRDGSYRWRVVENSERITLRTGQVFERVTREEWNDGAVVVTWDWVEAGMDTAAAEETARQALAAQRKGTPLQRLLRVPVGLLVRAVARMAARSLPR